MDDIKCINCGYVCDIGGLIGEHTNDCPKCGKNAFKAALKAGNIGAIVTHGQELHRIDSIDEKGLIYCSTLDKKPFYRVCKAADFWVLLDSFD